MAPSKADSLVLVILTPTPVTEGVVFFLEIVIERTCAILSSDGGVPSNKIITSFECPRPDPLPWQGFFNAKRQLISAVRTRLRIFPVYY